MSNHKQRDTPDLRSPFEKDIDKVTFSHHFRLLAGKSQVHYPLASATIRNRLTHSLEVSRIAASLTKQILSFIPARELAANVPDITDKDLINAASAASLLHDVGTTPFAHPTEKVIRRFFQTSQDATNLFDPSNEKHRPDFENFDANMQTFRIATRNGTHPSMRLTPLTLAAMIKYPCMTTHGDTKAGIFQTSEQEYKEVLKNSQKQTSHPDIWKRHPLAHITEAADDIAYLIADIEDAAMLNLNSFDRTRSLFALLLGEKFVDEAANNIPSQSHLIPWLRSQAISRLIVSISQTAENEEIRSQMIAGTLKGNSLLKHSDLGSEIDRLRKISHRIIYDRRIRPVHYSDPIPALLSTIAQSLNGRTTVLSSQISTYLQAADGHKAHALTDMICDLTDTQCMLYGSALNTKAESDYTPSSGFTNQD